ncbi:MAG: DUF6726 family protein [Acetobacteraceae bacterium]
MIESDRPVMFLSRIVAGQAILTPHSIMKLDAMRNVIRMCLGAAGLVALVALSGCGLVAAPCRVTSAGLKIVPAVGQVAAAPTDACANAIDPTMTRS